MQLPSKYFSVADGNSNTDFYSCIDNLFVFLVKPKLSFSYFAGHPYYVQSDERPGPYYNLILSLCDDEHNFSQMSGDYGTAQVWLRNDDSNELYITSIRNEKRKIKKAIITEIIISLNNNFITKTYIT